MNYLATWLLHLQLSIYFYILFFFFFGVHLIWPFHNRWLRAVKATLTIILVFLVFFVLILHPYRKVLQTSHVNNFTIKFHIWHWRVVLISRRSSLFCHKIFVTFFIFTSFVYFLMWPPPTPPPPRDSVIFLYAIISAFNLTWFFFFTFHLCHFTWFTRFISHDLTHN